MNFRTAVLGAVVSHPNLSGTAMLCGPHVNAVKKLPNMRLTLFNIQKNRTPCSVCVEEGPETGCGQDTPAPINGPEPGAVIHFAPFRCDEGWQTYKPAEVTCPTCAAQQK
jgi:hypothetical protein